MLLISSPELVYVYSMLYCLFMPSSMHVYKTLRLRKVDFVLAVGIWVGLGPELGSEKTVRK